MQIEDLVERWTSVHEHLPPLVLFSDLLDHLGHGVDVDGTDASKGEITLRPIHTYRELTVFRLASYFEWHPVDE